MKKLSFHLNRISTRTALLSMMMLIIGAACGGSASVTPKAVITSPQANAEIMADSPLQIQGQADGQGIIRVDVIVDSATLASVPASDAANGVSTLPVQAPFSTQTVGSHFAQLKVYGVGDKLIAVSDPVIFVMKLAAVTPTTAPQPTATAVPPTVTPTAVVSGSAELTNTAATTASVSIAPELTITNEFANIRSGPGINFNLVGKLNQNEKAPVRGKNQDGTWWQIAFDKGPNGVGWVFGQLVSVNAAAAQVAAVAAPPTPTSPPAPAGPTATPPGIVAQVTGTPGTTATSSGPVCDASSKDWRGQNPNYPFCANKDPTWADPQGDWNVYDNGRDIPLSISWSMYGSNINQVWIHFVQDDNICGFTKQTQHIVNQQVPAAGKYDFNVLQFPYGGTLKVYLTVTLNDGRTVQWGEKKLCIR